MIQPCLKVLLVEDSPSDARLIEHGLLQHRSHAFEVALAGRLDEALERLKSESFDVVLLDLGLPDSVGLDTLIRTSVAAQHVPIVVLTGADDQTTSLEAIRRGSQDYLVKSHADGEIVANAIRYAIERKQAEEKLKSLNEDLERRVAERTAVAERRTEQLRQLAAELPRAEQRERRRLALILHDGLQQTLVAAKLSLARIERGHDAHQAASAAAGLIDEAIDTSRSLTAELSPPILQQGGLIPTLKWLTQWFAQRHGLIVHLKAVDEIGPVPEDVTLLLFHSIRELLFNVVKHAGVKTAFVEVTQREGRVYVSIKDEGVGFDPMQLRAQGGTSGGFGLLSISERLSFLGGQITIESVPGRGSRFNLVLPYSPTITEHIADPSDAKISLRLGK